MRSDGFRKRTVVILVAVVAVSFLGALLWGVFGMPSESATRNSFSRSAIGHKMLVDLMRELGIPTTVSRYQSGRRAGDSALLLVVEPDVDGEEAERRLQAMVRAARSVLLILPKRVGVEDPSRRGWIESVRLDSVSKVERVLEALDIDARVVRPTGSLRWSGDPAIVPTLTQPQLILGDDLRPVVNSRAGALVAHARTRYGSILILADPDLAASHGLSMPGNAAAMLNLIGLERAADGPVVIDETLHGFLRRPSVFRALFEFPLVLATMQGVAALVILLWAAMGRFGPPLPVPPVLHAGKHVLIRNTAALLAQGDHAMHALRRYLRQTIASVRQQLHIPGNVPTAEGDALLDQLAESRGLEHRIRDLRRDAAIDAEAGGEARSVRRAAMRIHQWKGAMTGGPDKHP